MFKNTTKLLVPGQTLISGLLFICVGISLVTSSVEAQPESNREVRVAIDQLRATLISTSREIREVQRSTNAKLQSGLQKSLNQQLTVLTQINDVLDTIEDRQVRRIDSNQLYCSEFLSITTNIIDGCFLTNRPDISIAKTFAAIEQEGWHLTTLTPTGAGRMLAVYSRYVE